MAQVLHAPAPFPGQTPGEEEGPAQGLEGKWWVDGPVLEA